MSKAHSGKLLTEEHKRRIGAAHSGEQHWNWKGGVSGERYPYDWGAIKKLVHERDGGKCLDCGTTDFSPNRVPDVHRVDGDKSNIELDNLVSLCRSCHIIAEHAGPVL